MPENRDKDHPPVVLLRLSVMPCFWLLSELSPEDPDEAFGLCDLGLGFPELGYVDMRELLKFQSLVNVSEFKAAYPMSVFSEAARELCTVTLDTEILEKYSASLKGLSNQPS